MCFVFCDFHQKVKDPLGSRGCGLHLIHNKQTHVLGKNGGFLLPGSTRIGKGPRAARAKPIMRAHRQKKRDKGMKSSMSGQKSSFLCECADALSPLLIVHAGPAQEFW